MLKILEDLGTRFYGGTKRRFVKVECECGTTFESRLEAVKSGNTKSCGCLIKKILEDRNHKHGYKTREGTHPIYAAWTSIRQRCNNKNSKDYKDYGERGIEVCERWSTDFIPFKDWSEENGWNKGLSIDRIDVNGNYEPDNCRWIDNDTQSQNKRNTRLNPNMVREMRELHKEGNTIVSIAKRYDRNEVTVRQAINRKTWKNVI